VKDKIDEIATYSTKKIIKELYRGINELRGVTNLEVT
jgi:hypothetical protein